MSSPLLDFTLKCALALAAVMAHELGHIAAARAFGVRVKQIGVGWRGFFIRRARTTGWAEAAICATGAGANLALALAFWHLAPWFALANFIIGVVNLLPIAHSDGGHAIEALTTMRAVAHEENASGRA